MSSYENYETDPFQEGPILARRGGTVYRLKPGSTGFVEFIRRGRDDKKPVSLFIPRSMLTEYAVRYARLRLARIFGDLLGSL